MKSKNSGITKLGVCQSYDYLKVTTATTKCVQNWLCLKYFGLMHFECHMIRDIIIPLRPYLEKVKGCRQPDTFRFRQWVHQICITSGNNRAFIVDACVYLCVFPSHAVMLEYFPCNRGALERVVFCLFVWLLSMHFVGSNHVILQFKNS